MHPPWGHVSETVHLDKFTAGESELDSPGEPRACASEFCAHDPSPVLDYIYIHRFLRQIACNEDERTLLAGVAVRSLR